MKLVVGTRHISELIDMKFRDGSCILFRYGTGSGGDILLKQFLHTSKEGTHCVYLSTHETEEDIRREMKEIGPSDGIEVVSLQDILDRDLEPLTRKDRFRNEGIMVTDLLEISSNTGSRKKKERTENQLISMISSISRKQVLPFKLVIDSLYDLTDISNEREIERRIRIIKRSLREKGGTALIGAPLNWDGFRDREMTLFDGVMEVSADDSGGSWRRELLMKNIKGSSDPPERWDVTVLQNIPVARSLD